MKTASCLAVCFAILTLANTAFADQSLNLIPATIVTRSGDIPKAEATAATVLSEELEKRTGAKLPIATKWPEKGTVIALVPKDGDPAWGHVAPKRQGDTLAETRPEGYRVVVAAGPNSQTIVWVIGADTRGVLFGVGRILRSTEWAKGSATISSSFDVSSVPTYAIRGHQLGYRAAANSYDAWDPAKYDQYIRELAIFSTNCIENIPLQDDRVSPVMPITRQEMNIKMSEICDRYGLDYWVWVPADFDLNDQAKRKASLDDQEKLFHDSPRMDEIFFPGGDPGDNDPKLVMPFLEEVAVSLAKYHPNAKIWVSLQGFTPPQCDFFYDYVNKNMPKWLGGLVCGPSSPPIPESRKRMPAQYGLRHYPDVTHNVRAQYPVEWWDPAYAVTLGREAINPRPVFEAALHNFYAPYTNGFLSYSDGIHDDVNKVVWSTCAWDPNVNVRDTLADYARFFFGPKVADDAADGILALERNWVGSLAANGSVEGTLALWNDLAKRAPELNDNWRWQMYQLRANYDAYTRRRLHYESSLEDQVNAILLDAPTRGAEKAIDDASATLELATSQPISKDLRARIESLCADLFKSIGLQTSVAKYHASGEERGAVLDFVDQPLNNRWWLEDQFKAIKALPADQQIARLHDIAIWEHPGPGSFYDDIGNPGKSTHVVRTDGTASDPGLEHTPNPDHAWWEDGKTRTRLSWQSYMDWPTAVEYNGLDPNGEYVIRTTGQGQCLLVINGQKVAPTLDGKKIGELKEFPVPAELLKNRALHLTFNRPNEEGINWRQQSRLTEIWLIRKK